MTMIAPISYLEEIEFKNKSLAMQNYYIRKAKQEIKECKKNCRREQEYRVFPSPRTHLNWWKDVLKEMEKIHNISLKK